MINGLLKKINNKSAAIAIIGIKLYLHLVENNYDNFLKI